MGLAGKLKAGVYGGAPLQGGAPGTVPSAPPAPQGYPAPPPPSGYGQQQQQYGGFPTAPVAAYPVGGGPSSGLGFQGQGGKPGIPQAAYPPPPGAGYGGQQGNMQGGYAQGNQYGNETNGYGKQTGQQGLGQQGNQFGQYGQQGNQFGQAAMYGGQGAMQNMQQPGRPAPSAQGYGQAQTQGAHGSQGQAAGILAKLQSLVQVNGIQNFYPPQALQALAQKIEQTVDFDSLAARWGMPKELATDLACLALYDIVILADDSSSMAFEEQGERIEDLKIVLSKVAEVATLFDQDGILIRFLNSKVEGNGIRNAQEAEAILKQVRFQGLTPLAASMQSHVLEPVVFNIARSGQLQKPVLVITITDGEPSDSPRDAILQVISSARRRLAPQYGPKALAFQFAQVGRDQRAQHFLEKLDKHPEVGDIIDCTSYYELEAEEFARKGIDMTVEIWLVKLMVGAIDPSYDAEDEG